MLPHRGRTKLLIYWFFAKLFVGLLSINRAFGQTSAAGNSQNVSVPNTSTTTKVVATTTLPLMTTTMGPWGTQPTPAPEVKITHPFLS